MIEFETFTFDEDPLTDRTCEISSYDGVIGYASFDDKHHWEWEHSGFVFVPRDLSVYGIDTSEEDGLSLFKNGEVVYDTYKEWFVYADDEEPSMGGRYIGFEEGFWLGECFDYDSEAVIFQMLGD